MSVSSIGAQAQLAIQEITTMRSQFEDLQRQLSSGQKSATYAGLGIDRGVTVSLNSQLSAISGFDNTIQNVMARINLMNTALGNMLDNAGGDGSINSFLGSTVNTANSFALISQNSVTNASSLYAQIASQNAQNAAQKKLQDAIDAAKAAQQMVQPKNMLDPFIYLSDGSSIDTNNNILTRSDGTQIDITTGSKIIDSASIMQLANGAYLDTKNNIMTMPDGTQIDTVTGLKISVTA